MTDLVFHLIVGPNGAGKLTFAEVVVGPVTHLEFVNADVLAARHWPNDTVTHAYDAARLAADRRAELIARRASFMAETVFSHPSKLTLIRDAAKAGYFVTLHVVLIPEELAVARVHNRVSVGGHDVPDDKVRARFARLWPLVARGITLADESTVYDNISARDPFRPVATFRRGRPTTTPDWPDWAPHILTELTESASRDAPT